MTQDQYDEAVRLRKAGYSLAEAAEAVGVTKGTLTGCLRRGSSHNRAAPRVLSAEEVSEAIRRRRAGEGWPEIAKSLGVYHKSLTRRARAHHSVASDNPKIVLGAWHAGLIEPHKQRAIRPVIKPPAEVKALAMQFAAGKISRAEFVLRIMAGA